MKERFRSLSLIFIGQILCGIGIGFFLYANLGSDAASVLMDGISYSLDISFGTAAALLNIIILVIVFFIDKSYIHIASLTAIFINGYVADLTAALLNALPLADGLILRVVFMLIGLILLAIGVAIYVRANLGVGAVDLLAEIISDRSNLRYGLVRNGTDFLFIILGGLLGGTIGLGTIVSVLLLGQLIDIVRRRLELALSK